MMMMMIMMVMMMIRVEQSYHQPGWRRSMEELQRVLDTQVLTFTV